MPPIASRVCAQAAPRGQPIGLMTHVTPTDRPTRGRPDRRKGVGMARTRRGAIATVLLLVLATAAGFALLAPTPARAARSTETAAGVATQSAGDWLGLI